MLKAERWCWMTGWIMHPGLPSQSLLITSDLLVLCFPSRLVVAQGERAVGWSWVLGIFIIKSHKTRWLRTDIKKPHLAVLMNYRIGGVWILKSFQNFFASKRAAGTQIAHWNYLRRALSEEMRHIETMQVPRLFVWKNCLGMMDDSIVKKKLWSSS